MAETMSRPSSTLDLFRSVPIETSTSFRTSVAPARMKGVVESGGRSQRCAAGRFRPLDPPVDDRFPELFRGGAGTFREEVDEPLQFPVRDPFRDQDLLDSLPPHPFDQPGERGVRFHERELVHHDVIVEKADVQSAQQRSLGLDAVVEADQELLDARVVFGVGGRALDRQREVRNDLEEGVPRHFSAPSVPRRAAQCSLTFFRLHSVPRWRRAIPLVPPHRKMALAASIRSDSSLADCRSVSWKRILPEERDRFGGTQLSEGEDGLLPHPEVLVVEQPDQIGNHGRVADPSEDEAQVPYEIPVGVVELPPDRGDGFRVEPEGEGKEGLPVSLIRFHQQPVEEVPDRHPDEGDEDLLDPPLFQLRNGGREVEVDHVAEIQLADHAFDRGLPAVPGRSGEPPSGWRAGSSGGGAPSAKPGWG